MWTMPLVMALAGVSQAEPPRPTEGALAARFPDPGMALDTPGLAPGRDDATRNDELEAALRSLAGEGRASLVELGRTRGGNALLGLRFGLGANHPQILLIGQQHGNEPAPAEALLLLARRLADARDPLASVLEQVGVVMLPRANPDGAQAHQRGNGDGIDVNRDHLLLASVEARAIAMLARTLAPVVVVDLHEFQAMPRAWVAQGLAARHDLLVQYATTPNLNAALVRASEDWFRLPLWRDAEAAGLSIDWYHLRGSAPGRLSMGGVQPVLARNAFGLRHAVSLLLESRGLDLGRQHLARRVQTHLVALASVLQAAAEHAAALRGLQIAAAQAEQELTCGGTLVVQAVPKPTRRTITLIDIASGADVARDVAWASALTLQPGLTRRRPCAYWLDASATDVVERLRQLGVEVRTLRSPQWLEGERELPALDAAAKAVSTELTPGTWWAPAGGHLVMLDQPLAALAAAALEPGSEHGFVAHGLLASEQVARVTRRP